MKATLSPSIRSRLVLLVIACIGPAALMAVLLISYDYYRAREQLVHNSVMTARAMASALDKEFAIVESTLLTLATSPNLSRNDLSAFYEQASSVLRESSVINIVLGDADGKQFINTLLPFGVPLREDGFEGTTVEGIPVLAVFSRAPKSEWTVAIGIPSKDLSVDLNRRFIWLIVATIQ